MLNLTRKKSKNNIKSKIYRIFFMNSSDINQSISLVSKIHSKSADFLVQKFKEKGLPDFASSHGNILFQLRENID